MEKGIQTWISEDVHEKILKLSKERRVTLKYVFAELVRWAGESYEEDPESLDRLGIKLPRWPTD